MAFYSGFRCDKCGTTYESEGFDASAVHSITHLKRHARMYGWSVGKDKILCPNCRTKKALNDRKRNELWGGILDD